MAVVVLPTPPFWLAIAMILATFLGWYHGVFLFHVEREPKYFKLLFHVKQSLGLGRIPKEVSARLRLLMTWRR